MRPPRIALALGCALAITSVPSSHAQVVSVPPFTVAAHAFDVDVAAAYSGLYFLLSPANSGAVQLQRASGGPWPPPYTVSGGGPVSTVSLAAVQDGGFIAGWLQGFHNEVVGRVLDVVGAPTGSPFQVTSDDALTNGGAVVGGLAAGTAILWSESGPDLGVTLHARIANQTYTLASGPSEWSVATTPSGGCVVAWHFFDGSHEAVQAQVFDRDGLALTPPRTLGSTGMKLGAVAASPVDGTMAVVGALGTADPYVFEIRAFRFDATGAALGPEVVLGTARSAQTTFVTSIMPDADFDFAGNLYVVWADHDATSHGARARVLDPSGTPLGPAVTLTADVPLVSVRTARVPDGRFVNAWVAGGSAWAEIVSLCTPGAAVCGDGVLDPACERCDDGAANDDAAPGTCRTNCLPPHCGDGAVDAGEECDDGNFDACDGCDALCRIEPGVTCGDGVVSAICGEQCDDGNATLLDGCTPSCTWERVPGGGGTSTDCLAAWSLDNPTNQPAYDKKGRITARQRCVDGDPRCDFDAVPGACTFHVRACANNGDLAGCTPASRLSSWEVVRPSAKQAAARPDLAAVRTTLLATVPGGIVGPTARDVCSDEMGIVVTLRGTAGAYKPGKLKIQTRATAYDGTPDKDTLTLECAPAN